MAKKSEFHRKVFYRPVKVVGKGGFVQYPVVGMSDGEISMDFPYVEVECPLHSVDNLTVLKNKKGEFEVKLFKGTL